MTKELDAAANVKARYPIDYAIRCDLPKRGRSLSVRIFDMTDVEVTRVQLTQREFADAGDGITRVIDEKIAEDARTRTPPTGGTRG